MATVFFDLELHSPDVRSLSGGGWVVPKSVTHDDKGNTHVAPHCAGLGELEAQINLMKKDLEELLLKARRKFSQYEKMQPKSPF